MTKRIKRRFHLAKKDAMVGVKEGSRRNYNEHNHCKLVLEQF